MAKEDTIEVQGRVIESLPSNLFKVELDTGHQILAYLSGKMKVHRVRIVPGDRVKVAMTPYDLTRGRITYRLKSEAA